MIRLSNNHIQFNWIALVVILLLLFRLFLNGTIPLMDNTEARYAEIARIMVETNDWIVPQIDYGVPFWAKPPLSTWLSAGSFKIFGVNEFTARLPYFLLSVFIILMVVKYARREKLSNWIPALGLITTPQFFLHAGVVSTDVALAFSVALVMLSFWEAIEGNKRWYWKYLFFVGISLGLLAKGPIVVILTLPPLFIWTWLNRYFKRVWLIFPWLSGITIIAFMAVSWYYFAEKNSPGFLDYFVVGEHFRRFMDDSWTGDKYGFPKSQPLGMIWIFLLLFAFPWIQAVIAKTIKNRKYILKNSWLTFLMLWLLWTPIFFTTSKSLIHPYIMPVMVPLALLVVYWWNELRYRKIIVAFAFFIPIITIGIYAYAKVTDNVDFYANSDKQFVEVTHNLIPIFHFGRKSYSSQFYSRGKIKSIQLNKIEEHIFNESPFLVIIKNKDKSKIPEIILKELIPIEVSNNKTLYQFSIKNNDG